MRHLCLILLVTASMAMAQDILDRQKSVDNNQANTLFGEQRFEEARELYEKLLENDPDNGTLAYNLANTYAALGDAETAKQYYDQAMRSQQAQAKARSQFNKGTMALGSQNPGEAAKAFKDYLLENPNDIDAKRNLELALRMLEQQQQQQDPSENNEQNDDQDQEQDQNQQQNQQNNADDQQQQQQNDQQDSQDQQDPNSEQNENQQDNQDSQDQGDQQPQENQNPQDKQEDEQQEQPEPQASDKPLDDKMKQQILEAMNEQEKQQQKEYQKRKLGTVRRKAKDW